MAFEIRRDQRGNLLLDNMIVRGGVYYVRKRVNGRRVAVSLGFKVGDPWDKVCRKYRATMGQVDDGREGWAKKDKITLREWWQHYFTDHVVPNHRPIMGKKDGVRGPRLDKDGNLQYRAQKDVAPLLERFGSWYLADITTNEINKFIKSRKELHFTKGGTRRRMALTTVTKLCNALAPLFKLAMKKGHIDRNPWVDADRPIAHATRVITMTLQEQAQVEQHLAPWAVRWLNIMIGTGLRVSEGDAIPATNINLVERWIEVTRKKKRSQQDVQRVPLVDPAVIPFIEEQIAETGQMFNYSYSHYNHVLTEALLAAKVAKHITPHTLRHTFATRYLQAGGDIYILAKILGHSSVLITEKTYAHLVSADLLARSKGIRLGITPVEDTHPGTVLEFPAKGRE